MGLHDRCVGALGHEALERRRIALSSVPSRYQHGSVFHAGEPDGVPANALRRLFAELRIPRPSPGRHRPRRFRERVAVEVEVSALGPVRPGVRHGPDRGPHEAAFEPLKELLLVSPSSHIQPLR